MVQEKVFFLLKTQTAQMVDLLAKGNLLKKLNLSAKERDLRLVACRWSKRRCWPPDASQAFV